MRAAAPTVLAIWLCLLSAGAQARQDVRAMTCAGAREQVFQKGAAVFTVSETTYERFVEGQRQCQPFDEIAVPAIVATRDNSKCWVGYICRNRSDFKND